MYGSEEDDTACIEPKLAAFTKLPIEGGHHFDGNYDALAARLLAALRGGRRQRSRPRPPGRPPGAAIRQLTAPGGQGIN